MPVILLLITHIDITHTITHADIYTDITGSSDSLLKLLKNVFK